MNLWVNNQSATSVEGGTLADVIEQFGASGLFAVALNGQFVSKQDYHHTALTADDRIEILSPITGG